MRAPNSLPPGVSRVSVSLHSRFSTYPVRVASRPLPSPTAQDGIFGSSHSCSGWIPRRRRCFCPSFATCKVDGDRSRRSLWHMGGVERQGPKRQAIGGWASSLPYRYGPRCVSVPFLYLVSMVAAVVSRHSFLKRIPAPLNADTAEIACLLFSARAARRARPARRGRRVAFSPCGPRRPRAGQRAVVRC
jgi:hypothetical protein